MEVTYPEIEDAARLMWGIPVEFTPQTQPIIKQQNEMLQLRDAVASLITEADHMFDSGDWDRHKNMKGSRYYYQYLPEGTNQASLDGNLLSHFKSSKEAEPLDRLICPAITALQERTLGRPHSSIALIVTTIIFALVVCFVLGLSTLRLWGERFAY